MLQNPSRTGVGILRRCRRSLFPATALGAMLVSPISSVDPPASGSAPPVAPAATPSVHGMARSEQRAWMLDPAPSLKPERLAVAYKAPLEAAFRMTPVQSGGAVDGPPPRADEEPLRSLHGSAAPTAQPVPPVPLPVPRPAELRARPSDVPQVASGRAPRSTRMAALPNAPVNPAAPADQRSFFERLFGIRSTPGSALSYAALDSNIGSAVPGSRPGPALDQPSTGATAVYDITAQVVYMPNGERLEAHSGLGDKLDDPRFVHVRMRGATPPGTYDLTERERLFHGVRALRLNPVGGSAAIHGRNGLLAHTYMLGPNGDSNGCVSFKNYDRFLHAFLRGEVKRLVVVTGRGQDVLPSIAGNRNGQPQRVARSARDT
jgi:hypothetical protein